MSLLSSPPFSNYALQGHQKYTPQTPSPLRTSRNANLMPPSTTSSSTSKLSSSPFSVSSFSPSSLAQVSRQHDRDSPPHFHFQARSRSQSPQASLAKTNATAKDRRRSLFLGKVRQNRDDTRFETRVEQSLRMDFVRERREWEEKLKRRAPETEFEADLDEAMEERGVDDDENGMPSPSEEREIEELLSYLETDEVLSLGTSQNHGEGSGHQNNSLPQQHRVDLISDDDDYDQLFMEVIGVEGQTQQPQSAHYEQAGEQALVELNSSMDLS